MLGTGLGRRGAASRALRRCSTGSASPRRRTSGRRSSRAASASASRSRRAFANQPQLVLADEPTGSLDEESGAAVIELLRSCCDDGGAVLAVSHDPRLTAAADRVVRLAHGRIHAVPSPMARAAQGE